MGKVEMTNMDIIWPYAQNEHYIALWSKWTLYGPMVKVEMIWPYEQSGNEMDLWAKWILYGPLLKRDII